MEKLRRSCGLPCLIHCLELQDGAYFGEGWIGPHQGYEGDLLLELLPETNKEGVDEFAVVHVITELMEFIANRLDALAEDGHGCVALGGGAELGMESIDAGITIVLKKLLEREP